MRLSVAWLAILVACGHEERPVKEEAPAAEPLAVQTAVAEARERPRVTEFLGSFVAEQDAKVAADANGTVTRVLVDRGEAVSAGQVLVEIDGRTAALSADASAAQVALASAQASALAADCRRFEALYAEGAISASQLERSKAQCEAQARAVDAATASLRIAETQRGKTAVRAPFAGVVDERMVEVGEFVGAATPVVSLVAVDPIRARFSVPERALGQVQGATEVVVRAAALPEATFRGELLPLPPAARERSRDLVLEARVPNPDGLARPGLSVTVQVVGGAEPVVAVPPAAVLDDDTVHRVFVVAEGLAVEHVVHVEPLDDGTVAVSPGVEPGDSVVLQPPPSLRDGTPVR